MTSFLRSALLLALPLALGACGGADKKEKDQRTAAGEILPGSISDSMLPYDTVRSQAPLAPKTLASGKAKGGETSDEGTPDSAAEPTASSAAEAPAAATAPAAPTE
jgi:hypothetical protein